MFTTAHGIILIIYAIIVISIIVYFYCTIKIEKYLDNMRENIKEIGRLRKEIQDIYKTHRSKRSKLDN